MVLTKYGDVSLETLIEKYEQWKKSIEKHVEARTNFLQTEEGKEWNRKNSKTYYEKHKSEILEKRRLAYQKKKHELLQSSSSNQSSSNQVSDV